MNTSIVVYSLQSPSGKFYIGQTKRGLEIRWHEHTQRWQKWIKKDRPRKTYMAKLHYAFDKYPPESWTRKILFESSDPHEIDLKEDENILSYDSIANGYNIQRGGGGWHGGTVSDRHRENISTGRKRYWETSEGQIWKKQLRERFEQNNPSVKGLCKHIPTEEEKIKISEKQKQRWAAGFYNNKKPLSPESIEKMRQTKLQQWADPEKKKELELKMNRIGMTGKNQSDFQKQQASEANSKTWLVTHPDGKQKTIVNLNKFCKEHKLNSSNFINWGKTKGYRAIKISLVVHTTDYKFSSNFVVAADANTA